MKKEKEKAKAKTMEKARAKIKAKAKAKIKAKEKARIQKEKAKGKVRIKAKENIKDMEEQETLPETGTLRRPSRITPSQQEKNGRNGEEQHQMEPQGDPIATSTSKESAKISTVGSSISKTAIMA